MHVFRGSMRGQRVSRAQFESNVGLPSSNRVYRLLKSEGQIGSDALGNSFQSNGASSTKNSFELTR